jgi:mRNA-degrading endonuclease RelE of RelBE toxin-antitoxin system
MRWTVELAPDAADSLARLPRDARERLRRAIDTMEEDPFRSNVKPLKGPEWAGRYRKKVGPYRIIFMPNHAIRTVAISAILTRSKGTYR